MPADLAALFPEADYRHTMRFQRGDPADFFRPTGGASHTPHPASGHPLPSSDEGRGQGEGCSSSEGVLEILQWKRGANQKSPTIHKIHSPAGEGWGNHLGFDEIHTAFLDAVLDGKPHLTTVRDCLDGSLLAIAAEESSKQSTKTSL